MESQHGTAVGIDVHKKMVVVAVLQSAQPDQDYANGVFGTTQFGLRELVAFLRQDGVQHAAMESTAQYWRPVWMALEGDFTLTLDAEAIKMVARMDALFLVDRHARERQMSDEERFSAIREGNSLESPAFASVRTSRSTTAVDHDR